MRVTIDPWDPSYGTSADEAGAESEAAIDLTVERPLVAWAAVAAPPGLVLPEVIQFVDGVRRVDARVWIEPDAAAGSTTGDSITGPPSTGSASAEPALAASWAAGVVVCVADGRAQAVLGPVEVGRGLFSACAAATDLVTRHGTYRRRPATTGAPDDLSLALQQAMNLSEIAVAGQAAQGAATASRNSPDGWAGRLLVVDGPLRGRQGLADAIGLIKTHHTHYLPVDQRGLLGQLAPGERTPLFRIASSWIRHAWYLRLPGGGGGPMAGIVRCECSADVSTDGAVGLADWSAATLPRYASAAHKDARAPQNLYPIGGLERELRRRLGDSRLLYRALRSAA
jgi:hypothetical protein